MLMVKLVLEKTTAVILWLRKQKKSFFWINVDKHTNIIGELKKYKKFKR